MYYFLTLIALSNASSSSAGYSLNFLLATITFSSNEIGIAECDCLIKSGVGLNSPRLLRLSPKNA